ncbi:MAG: nuclear transport factor 2 family protein [Pseudomonadales bacterium]
MGTWDDQLAIADLIHRYSRAVNDGDDQSLREFYTEGGVFAGLTGEFQIDTQFDAYVESLSSMRAGAFPNLRQLATTPVVDVDGDRAVAHTPVLLLATPPGGETKLVKSGVLRDELVRTEAGWRFKRREARVDGVQ